MEPITVKYKVLDARAKVPAYATPGAAAADLCAVLDAPLTVAPMQRVLVPTGLAIELPDAGCVALVYARSGLSIKHGLCMANGVSTVSETIFDYFTSFLPYFAVQLSPLFVFIAVIFFTSKLAGNSEIIAMLSAGVSYRRLLVPYMIGAAVIAGLTFWLSNYAIPPSNVKRLEYTNKYVKNKKVTAGTNIQLQVQPGVIAFMGRYEAVDHTGYRFSLDKFNDKQLVSHLTARSITYDTTAVHKWKIKDYMIRQMDGMKESITKGDRIDTTLFMEPADFLIMKNQQEMLTSPQLSEYISRQRQRGFANIKEFEIEYHKRIAMSFASFILTLIGVSLSSKKTKGGMGLHLGIGLALSFSYILFQTIASTFAVNGNMPPVIAVWIPNIMYAFIAFYLYRKAPK